MDKYEDINVDNSSPLLKSQTVSLCDEMWNTTKDIRNLALATTFVQELKQGTLDPTTFGGYMVQDSVYCQKLYEGLKTASENTTDADLKEFLKAEAKFCKRLYKELFKEWHIYDASGIELGTACQQYVDILNNIANNMDPVYFLVACIPCTRLWPWIGQKIIQETCNFGCYTKWIQVNFDPKIQNYLPYEARVNAAFQQGKLDKATALDIYKKCMTVEADFFASAKDN